MRISLKQSFAAMIAWARNSDWP